MFKTNIPESETLNKKESKKMMAKKNHGLMEFRNNMIEEIDKKDFDIALIGCGAYGMPLAAHIKSKEKQALHLGETYNYYGG